MNTIFIEVRQVTSRGRILENVLETEKVSSLSLKEYWQGHEHFQNVKVSKMLIEVVVINEKVYLPNAMYPNWLKEQYIPSHWNVNSIQ